MHEFLTQFSYWYWFGIAAFLLIFEVLTVSGFLLWIGVSALVVGAILFFVPTMSAMVQWLTFAVLSIVLTVGWKIYLKKGTTSIRRTITLNKRGELYVGRVFTLDVPVVNGMGIVRVDDTTWRIQCVDLPAGSRIKIVGVDGVILLAEPQY